MESTDEALYIISSTRHRQLEGSYAHLDGASPIMTVQTAAAARESVENC